MERRGGTLVPSADYAGPLARRIGINWDYLMGRRPWVLKHTQLPPYLLLPEVHLILNAAKNANVHFMFNTLWHTGCRVSELTALTRASFLLETEAKAEVSLKTLKQRGRPKKGAVEHVGPRAVPVRDPDYVLEVQRYFATHKPKAGERIFDVSRQSVNKRLMALVVQVEAQLKEEGKVLGVHVTPHTFRHSFAINAVLHGVPAPVLQKWLGHKHMSSTEIYTQVLAAETGHLMEWVEY